MLLPDDPRLEPEPELERVLDPELREDPEELPDQLLLREDEELRVVVLRVVELRVAEGRVVELEFDPVEPLQDEDDRVVLRVALREGEVDAGWASMPRQTVRDEAGSPVASISSTLLVSKRPPPALEFTDDEDQIGVRGATTLLLVANVSEP